ncbi:MAG: hypothetical protein RR855_17975 [Comamonas sp.]
MRTALDYLIFDYSEDEEGGATWDAMATVTTDRWPALQAEVLQVLHWADQRFPRQRGALDEGATWDFDISLSDSAGRDLRPAVQGQPLTLQHAPLPAGDALTLTLTLTGRAAFADALLQTFELE